MSKTFREWNVEQPMMFPASVMDFVPLGHVAHFVRNLVVEQLDLKSIMDQYSETRGYPPYHPTMMTSLILYAYTQGIYSSRRIARACEQRVDFMAITGLQQPDFRTISDFRKRHLKQLGGLFGQVLKLCQQAGMVKLAHVALDGTRIAGNAAKDQTLKYERMKKSEQELAEEIAGWFRQAEREDGEEDAEYGVDRRGDELPSWVSDKQRRLEKIRQAKAELEAEAKAEAERKKAEEEQKPARYRAQEPIPDMPAEDAKRNLTDGDSRLLKTSHGYIQGYNAQAAVDADSQVIVAEMLTNERNDLKHLVPLIAQIEANTDDAVREISTDTGYYSENNAAELQSQGIRGYMATGRRDKDGRWHGDVGPLGRQMRARFEQARGQSRYRLRARTVEPVFGIIKSARGFRQFLLRGIENVSAEWSLLCTAHNVLKLVNRLAGPKQRTEIGKSRSRKAHQTAKQRAIPTNIPLNRALYPSFGLSIGFRLASRCSIRLKLIESLTVPA
jgi:transposase